LTARELLPPKDDEYRADTEATDQETEIGVFGQKLKHDIRLAHEPPARQREQIVFMGSGLKDHSAVGKNAFRRQKRSYEFHRQAHNI
jgi:hypothetical protein